MSEIGSCSTLTRPLLETLFDDDDDDDDDAVVVDAVDVESDGTDEGDLVEQPPLRTPTIAAVKTAFLISIGIRIIKADSVLVRLDMEQVADIYVFLYFHNLCRVVLAR